MVPHPFRKGFITTRKLWLHFHHNLTPAINKLAGNKCSDKAFMSVSFNKDINYFKRRRQILVVYDTPKGTHAYATANLGESEAILGRNTPAEILGAYYDKGLGKLIVRMKLFM